jgi:dienelactone hydrolase/tRNA A-37 threonylcarbamoyl transferase component Bud32
MAFSEDTEERLKEALADRYRIDREIGSGGMATVYLAHDLKHDREVAIKVMRPELSAILGPERFLQEIRIVAKLSHPHILALYDSGQAEGLLYYVLPYVEGESLRPRLERDKQLPIEEAVAITQQVAAALDYAHGEGVVHRDIKPENILLYRGQAMVADFGIALAVRAAAGERLTETGLSLGTPEYMSPEQATGDRALTPASDIYSLGALLYETLTGEPPHSGGTVQSVIAKLLTERPISTRTIRETIPEAVDSTVMKALAKLPADRYPSAGEFGDALGSALTTGVKPKPVPGTPGLRAWLAAWRWRLAALTTVVVIGGGFGWEAYTARRQVRWARTEALPGLRRLAEANQWDSAFRLATQIESIIPGDSILGALWPRFSSHATIQTDPPGARVHRRPIQENQDTSWQFLGTTPLDSIWFPAGVSRLRIEMDGHETRELSGWGRLGRSGRWLGGTFTLDRQNSTPPGMVRVNGFESAKGIWDAADSFAVHDYYLGRYEVTNRQYKEFVDAGGYARREFWVEPFVNDARGLTWEEGMGLLVDRTGRPGPSTWEVGAYPAGQDDHPVGGISWYEAAAYARFEGKSLPSVWHLNMAIPDEMGYAVTPRSNIARTSTAAPVGSFQGMGRFGTFDQYGNVREWAYNAQGEERTTFGGSWSDADYMAAYWRSVSAWDRSPENGIRLAVYLDSVGIAGANSPVPPVDPSWRDYAEERPAGPLEYSTYVGLYAYDKAPLVTQVERADTSADWIRERVSFTAGYGVERVAAYVYLPRRGRPPYQAVLYWPGSGVLEYRGIEELSPLQIHFFLNAGRAVALPVFKGTLDRDDEERPIDGHPPEGSHRERELTIQWVKDLRRTIDYLETRPDIDTTRLAYHGHSWGGTMLPIALATEPRLKAGIAYVGGLDYLSPLAEVDPFNFVSRVTVPVLMVSGRHDTRLPYEVSQVPMFELLGTPAEHKRHAVFDGGHFVPLHILARESLAWLDRYLGPIAGF